jgi:hypothetical protein
MLTLEEENAKLKKHLAEADAGCRRAARAVAKKVVGPVAEREGVAHLQAVMGLSERRACQIIGADRKMVRYRYRRPPTPSFVPGCATWPTSGGGSATAGYSSCCAGRAKPQVSTASTGTVSRGRALRAQSAGAAQGGRHTSGQAERALVDRFRP